MERGEEGPGEEAISVTNDFWSSAEQLRLISTLNIQINDDIIFVNENMKKGDRK